MSGPWIRESYSESLPGYLFRVALASSAGPKVSGIGETALLTCVIDALKLVVISVNTILIIRPLCFGVFSHRWTTTSLVYLWCRHFPEYRCAAADFTRWHRSCYCLVIEYFLRVYVCTIYTNVPSNLKKCGQGEESRWLGANVWMLGRTGAGLILGS